MLCKLGFSRASDGRFLVTTEILSGTSDSLRGTFTTTAFADENIFIYYIVLADIDEEETTALIANVLLANSEEPHKAEWVDLDLTERQILGLALDLPAKRISPGGPCDFANGAEYQELLMQVTAPLAVMAGPEHTFTFANPAYVQTFERTGRSELIGIDLRQAMPELQGQQILRALDDVYRTGMPYVGKALPADYKKVNAAVERRYFDIAYHPIRERDGSVCGILCQTDDVTERVLERQVSDSREARLYRQWAELDALYRMSPFGMTLVNAKEYRMLRVNQQSADMTGHSVEALVGKKVFEVFPELDTFLGPLYERVTRGDVVRNVRFSEPIAQDGTGGRNWIVTFSPVFDSLGLVEAIASLAVEITCEDYVEEVDLHFNDNLSSP